MTFVEAQLVGGPWDGRTMNTVLGMEKLYIAHEVDRMEKFVYAVDPEDPKRYVYVGTK